MAGDWIPMRLDLHEDPAVIWMADQLETREEHVVGYCHKFWSFVSRQCHDGSVTGVTLESLGRVTHLPGFPELLVEVGWLEVCEIDNKPAVRIPGFEEWLSQSAKSRHLASKRQRAKRHAKNEQMSRPDRDKSVTTGQERTGEDNKNRPPKKSPRFDASSLTLPEGLASLGDLWGEWCRHRVEIRKPLTKTSATKQLDRLAEMGLERARIALNHTMSNGWQGIREPDQPASGNGQQSFDDILNDFAERPTNGQSGS